MKNVLGVIFLCLLLTGCGPKPTGAELAERTLVVFFDNLHREDYQAAVDFYGGSYQTISDMNPDLDPADHISLWRQACGFNGFVCLPVGEVLAVESSGEGEFTFTVHFQTEAGEVFVLGPCCGADETEMPPVSEFSVRVVEDETGKYKVLDLPPYVP